ncbi:Serine/threonine-protein kinase CTR1 [Pelomyxa schiedti]|nr:Serine/threonine-protein kinase CTR1 [Pelomyxa schiedti]
MDVGQQQQQQTRPQTPASASAAAPPRPSPGPATPTATCYDIGGGMPTTAAAVSALARSAVAPRGGAARPKGRRGREVPHHAVPLSASTRKPTRTAISGRGGSYNNRRCTTGGPGGGSGTRGGGGGSGSGRRAAAEGKNPLGATRNYGKEKERPEEAKHPLRATTTTVTTVTVTTQTNTTTTSSNNNNEKNSSNNNNNNKSMKGSGSRLKNGLAVCWDTPSQPSDTQPPGVTSNLALESSQCYGIEGNGKSNNTNTNMNTCTNSNSNSNNISTSTSTRTSSRKFTDPNAVNVHENGNGANHMHVNGDNGPVKMDDCDSGKVPKFSSITTSPSEGILTSKQESLGYKQEYKRKRLQNSVLPIHRESSCSALPAIKQRNLSDATILAKNEVTAAAAEVEAAAQAVAKLVTPFYKPTFPSLTNHNSRKPSNAHLPPLNFKPGTTFACNQAPPKNTLVSSAIAMPDIRTDFYKTHTLNYPPPPVCVGGGGIGAGFGVVGIGGVVAGLGVGSTTGHGGGVSDIFNKTWLARPMSRQFELETLRPTTQLLCDVTKGHLQRSCISTEPTLRKSIASSKQLRMTQASPVQTGNITHTVPPANSPSSNKPILKPDNEAKHETLPGYHGLEKSLSTQKSIPNNAGRHSHRGNPVSQTEQVPNGSGSGGVTTSVLEANNMANNPEPQNTANRADMQPESSSSHVEISDQLNAQAFRAFQLADKNKDCLIDVDELYKLLKIIYKEITWPEVNCIYNKIDTNRSGKVTFDEFVQAAVQYKWDLNKYVTEFTKLPDTFDWEIPFDQLQMGQCIGEGTFGKVHKATWRGCPVAVKFLLTTQFTVDLLADFKQEISILSKLRHPNIVLFMGASTQKHKAIVMELVPGVSMDHMETMKPAMHRKDILRVAYHTALGLNYLHLQDPPIVHRDVKPSNVIYDPTTSTIKLIDFGLSCVKRLPNLSEIVGTPIWMGPELLRGNKYNEKVDVYSFALCLWSWFHRETPLLSLTFEQLIQQVGFKNHRPTISKRLESEEPEVVSLIRACWQDPPAKRPPFSVIITNHLFSMFH